jgi:hypothetical protein
MNQNLRRLADLDRVIHEPGRLMIVALLYAVEAGYVKITKTYHGKVPRIICKLLAAGRAAFERYRKALKLTL